MLARSVGDPGHFIVWKSIFFVLQNTTKQGSASNTVSSNKMSLHILTARKSPILATSGKGYDIATHNEIGWNILRNLTLIGIQTV